jgi:hypothetical protein
MIRQWPVLESAARPTDVNPNVVEPTSACSAVTGVPVGDRLHTQRSASRKAESRCSDQLRERRLSASVTMVLSESAMAWSRSRVACW